MLREAHANGPIVALQATLRTTARLN